MSGGTKNNVLVTKPSERFQDTRVIIPAHASIGFHQHVENTEPYYVLKGKGIFEDNDHTETEIHPGDVCVIEVGQSHAIKNPFDEPLEIMALVINERGKEI